MCESVKVHNIRATKSVSANHSAIVALSRFKLAKTLLSGKIQMGTELSPLTHGTSASIGGSLERHVVSPTTKNCCETSLARVEGGVA